MFNSISGCFWHLLKKCNFGQWRESISYKMPIIWTVILYYVYIIYHIVFIVFLVLDWLSNLEFDVGKKLYKLPKWGGGGVEVIRAMKERLFFLRRTSPRLIGLLRKNICLMSLFSWEPLNFDPSGYRLCYQEEVKLHALPLIIHYINCKYD